MSESLRFAERSILERKYADDVFTINYKWLFEYSAELDRRGLHLPFETISREDRLNEEVVQTLAHMGCYRLWIGAESGSQRVLDAMKRRTNAERVRAMVHLLQKYGIEYADRSVSMHEAARRAVAKIGSQEPVA